MAENKVKSGFKKLAVGAIVAVIALSFAIFGISDIFTGQSNRAVAVVGSAEIDIRDYQGEYDRTLQRLSSERGGRISANQAKSEGLDQQVLSGMVVRQSIQNHAEDLGITTSDRRVIKEIKSVEAFNGILNEFDEATFQSVLRDNGYTSLGYEKTVREELTRSQILDTVSAGVEVPTGMVEAIVRSRLERREGSYIVLGPELAGQMEDPTEDVLMAYYETNLLRYMQAETRDISFLLVAAKDFAADVVVTDEEVRELYDRQIVTFTTPETRYIERLFGTREQMVDAKARIEAGESFVSVGASLDLSVEEVDLGNVIKEAVTDVIVAKAAFGLEAPGMVGPLEGLSWALARVVSITPETITPFEDAAGDLREALVLREADKVMGDQLETIDEDIASGVPLEEIASRIGLPLHAVKGVTRSGMLPSGVRGANIPEDPELLKEAFASVKNFDSDLIEFGSNEYFVVRVDEISLGAPREFAIVQAEALTQWHYENRGNALRDLAIGLVERGNDGEDFNILAAEVGRGVLKSVEPFARNQTTELFSDALNRQLFNVKEGNFFFAPVNIGESLVVMRMDAVVVVDEQSLAPYVEIIKQQLDQGLSDDARQFYIAGLGVLYETRQNPKAIDLATGQTTQPGF